jgi:hypothetical protein
MLWSRGDKDEIDKGFKACLLGRDLLKSGVERILANNNSIIS